jgi:hypothetical protein
MPSSWISLSRASTSAALGRFLGFCCQQSLTSVRTFSGQAAGIGCRKPSANFSAYAITGDTAPGHGNDLKDHVPPCSTRHSLTTAWLLAQHHSPGNKALPCAWLQSCQAWPLIF